MAIAPELFMILYVAYSRNATNRMSMISFKLGVISISRMFYRFVPVSHIPTLL